ncbi:MAG: hypothetical protein SFV32_01780 [Opitutaceae bacterium]|nr:hypothetical protein [Opitutaceae bacterium]
MATPQKDPLESFVHDTLRSVSVRRAPLSLEQRVMAQLSRRAALPWYRQNFRHWPIPARVLFLFTSAGLVAAALLMCFALARNGFGGGVSDWLAQVKHQAVTLRDFGSTVMGLLPASATWWIAGAFVAFASMSVATVGLGAAAYRLLWKNS